MTEKAERVEVRFHGGDLPEDHEFEIWEVADRYSELLKEELEDIFPDAEIVIDYDEETSDDLYVGMQFLINGEDEYAPHWAGYHDRLVRAYDEALGNLLNELRAEEEE